MFVPNSLTIYIYKYKLPASATKKCTFPVYTIFISVILCYIYRWRYTIFLTIGLLYFFYPFLNLWYNRKMFPCKGFLWLRHVCYFLVVPWAQSTTTLENTCCLLVVEAELLLQGTAPSPIIRVKAYYVLRPSAAPAL